MALTRKPWQPGGFSTLKPKRRKPSKRSKDPVTAGIYALGVARSEGRCEAHPDLHPAGRCGGRLHVHHRIPLAWGGNSGVCNLLHLCEAVHTWAHAHPAAAVTHGLLVPRRCDPARWPLLTALAGVTLLSPSGEYEEAP